MDGFINHYLILGLPSGEEAFEISKVEITKAYRLKALKIHPDKRRDDPNAVVAFQTLQASYEILKNDYSRKVFNESLMIRILEYKGERCSNVEDDTTRMMSKHAEEIRRWRTMFDRRMKKKMDDLKQRNRMSVMKNGKCKRMRCNLDQNARSTSYARMMKDLMR